MKAAIFTISDKGSQGERDDRSGPAVRELLESLPAEVVQYEIIPDEADQIEAKLREVAGSVDLIVTTGGTGVAPRDVTPEATARVIERELPGFAEAMRRESSKITPHALLSRAMAGLAGGTLIVNLPGSPKGAKECLSVVLPAIPHTIEKAQGHGGDCAPG